MSNSATTTPKRSGKPKDAGDWKLCVYFIDHKQSQGRPYTFWSHRSHDKRNVSENRFKQFLNPGGRWWGKVQWAALYYCPGDTFFGPMEWVWKLENGEWRRPEDGDG